MSQWKPKAPRTRALVVRNTTDPSASPWEGKYEDLCVEISQRTDATGVVLLVLDGERGTGFQSTFKLGASLSDADMPAILRRMASMIEANRRGGSKN